MSGQHLIHISEAQRLSGLDKSTLYKLIRKGQLRSFQVLSGIRLDRKDVEALITERPPRDAA
jgi:excisionase family DNA binding protein